MIVLGIRENETPENPAVAVAVVVVVVVDLACFADILLHTRACSLVEVM